MPKGVVVEIDGADAIIDFVDRTLRGPGLAKLIEIGGPDTIQTMTRTGPRVLYRVPEGNAREAGLIDGPADAPPPAPPSTPPMSQSPVVEHERPTLDWTRKQLDDYAAGIGLDTTGQPNKEAALAAITSQEAGS